MMLVREIKTVLKEAFMMNFKVKGDMSSNSIITYILTFFLFSFIGWLWEGLFVGREYGAFINRGFLHGPCLPIYGIGCVLMILLLTRFRKNPLLVFIGACIVCGSTEYITSWLLESVFHRRWWDYSGCFMNLNGRVCMQTLIAFGVAGIFVVNFASPIINKVIRKIPESVLRLICILLSFVYLIDTIISLFHPNCGVGITL